MRLTMKSVFTILFMSSVPTAFATTITLNATADARILSVFSTSNFGSDVISTFNSGGNTQHTAIKFDVSSLTGVNIVSAQLRLFGAPFFGSTNSATNSVWRIGQDWTENQVSWNNATTGTPWTSAGGHFFGSTGSTNSNPYSTTSYVQAANIWLSHDVTTLVQEWVNGTHTNFGFMLTATSPSEMIYVSREGLYSNQSFAGNVPELVIETEAVPEPFTLLALAGMGALVAKRRKNS